MTISINNFHDLPKAQQDSIRKEFSENFNPAYLTNKFSRNNVNAEVVTDEDGTLYDIRVFDPYSLVRQRANYVPRYMTVDIGADGWSDWLLGYTDPEGNDVDEIIENFDGEPQGVL